MTQSLLGAYLQFLRSPDLTTPPSPPSSRQIIRQSLRLYCLHLMLLIGVAILIGQVIEQNDSVFPDLIQDMSMGVVFLLAVVVAPLLEETIFRLPLRGSGLNLGISLGLMMMFGLGSGLIGEAMAVLVGVMIVGERLYRRWRKPAIAWFYARFPQLIFYSFSLLFGAVHITNYEEQVWRWLPLLVLPQVLVGLWFGFVRVQYGFVWAILAHAFHNGCLLLPVLLLESFGSAQLVSNLGASDPTTWSGQDMVLVLGVSLYVLGGLLLCALKTWELIREWHKKRLANSG